MASVKPNDQMRAAQAAFSQDIKSYNAARGRSSRGALLQQAQSLFDQQQAAPQQSNWDKFWRPASNVLNALGSIGYGVEQGFNSNFDAMNKELEAAKTEKRGIDVGNIINPAQIGKSFGAFGEGVAKAVTGRADELKTGSDLIEKAGDLLGKAGDPNYKDVKDNVNPWVKGVGGFATDLATDPLTFLPSGAISSVAKGAAKGAVKAAREAGDLSKGLRTATGDLVGEASSLEKTAAMPGGALKGGAQGFKDWIAAGGRDASAKGLQARVAKRVANGTATPDDLFLASFKKAPSIQAQAVDAAVAKGAAEKAQRAAEDAQRMAEAAAPKPAEDAVSNASEAALRQDIVKHAVDTPAPQAAAFLKPTSQHVQQTLRRLTYTVPVHSAPLQRAIRGLQPLAKDAPKEVKAAWHATAAPLLGTTNARVLSKVTDPEEFARTAEALASERIQRAHTSGQKVSDILKGLQSPTRQYKTPDLKEAARLLGLTQDGVRVPRYRDLFQGRGAQEAFNEMVRAERQQQKAFVAAGVPDGRAIEGVAETINPKNMAGAASADLLHMAETIGPERVDELNNLLGKGLKDALGDPAEYKKVGQTTRFGEPFKTNMADTKAVLTHVWEQHKNYAFYKKALNNAVEKADALGLKAGERIAFIGDRMEEAVNFLDTRLRSLGITPVSTKLGKESMSFGTGKAAEHAFLGLSDIWKALGRDFLDPLLFRGPGTQFPLTVLQDAARFALKEAGTETSHEMQIANLVKNITTDLRRGVGVGPKARDYWLSEAHPLVADIATKLMDPQTITKLTESHIQNGAMARAVVGTQAQRMAGPVAESMQAMLKLPSGTSGSDIDAVMKASRDLTNAAAREGLEGSDAARLANFDLDLAMAQNLDTGQMLQVKASHGMDQATVIGPRGPLNATDTARLVDEGSTKAGARTETRKATMETAKNGAKTALTDEVRSVTPQIEELANTISASAIASGAEEAAMTTLDSVRADLTMGLPNWLKSAYRGAERMSGGFGYRDLQADEIAAAMSTRKMTNTFRENVHELTQKHSEGALRGAFAILQRADSNEAVDAILKAGQTEAHAAARDLWPVMKVIFDHSDHNLFRRVGYSSDYINNFLRKVGVAEDFWLNGNHMSWEIAKQWKRWDFPPEHDPMKVMSDYVNAMNQASVLPTIAASFSAEFGHTSTTYGAALTRSEALSRGWKSIDTKGEKGLGAWLDPEQLYPPEMLKQLSMMDQYLGTSRILDGGGAFDRAFRTLDPIINMMKTSITLWRPGHHVTNIIGEGLMNGLAGVWNPKSYADALAVMSTGGFLKGEAHTKLNQLIRESAPEGMQLRNADRIGGGVWVTINGKATQLSYDSVFRLLDDAGILIHHNQAEDLLNEGQDLYKTGSKLQRRLQLAQKKFAPNWLGEMSAQRDNVFRVAHAIDLLSKKHYRSIPDAMRQVATTIHSFHPNMQTLSAFEQKYVRRFIYFYTWQRQALTRVLESMIDTPGRVTAATKAVYGLSVANGTDPESFGHPMPNDERIPSYMAGNFNSFLFQGGLAPMDNADSMLWSASLNAPQLDVLQSVFGGVAFDPSQDFGTNAVNGAGQFLEGAVLQNATPVARIPAELATGHRFGSGSQIKDTGAYLMDQTGLSYPRKLGLFGPQSDDSQNPQEEAGKQQAALLNYLLGARITNVTSPANTANSRREQAQFYNRFTQMMGNQAGGQ